MFGKLYNFIARTGCTAYFVLLIAVPIFIISALIDFFTEKKFEVPPLVGRVVDQTETLTPSEKEKLDQTIQMFEAKTDGQIFVAFLKPFDNESIEEVGIKLMDTWKPGQKGKDNGAILLIVPKKHKMRLEIGYGWEEKVTDAKAGDIIRMMAPFFREERYCDGVLMAIGQLAYDITGEKLSDHLPIPEEETEQEDTPDWISFLIFLIFLIFAVFIAGRHKSGGGGGFYFGGFGGGGGCSGGGFSGGGGGGGGGGGASGSW